jgi:pimeloyl-ACP methyl ester carboxylesterase
VEIAEGQLAGDRGTAERAELETGGHFAAFEQPETFVNEVRSFFRLVR